MLTWRAFRTGRRQDLTDLQRAKLLYFYHLDGYPNAAARHRAFLLDQALGVGPGRTLQPLQWRRYYDPRRQDVVGVDDRDPTRGRRRRAQRLVEYQQYRQTPGAQRWARQLTQQVRAEAEARRPAIFFRARRLRARREPPQRYVPL